jgi:hypothetical protein
MQVFMLASFFEVDVCSLAKMESKFNRAEKGGRRGGAAGVPEGQIAQVCP